VAEVYTEYCKNGRCGKAFVTMRKQDRKAQCVYLFIMIVNKIILTFTDGIPSESQRLLPNSF
jgi:hypothetical protein